MIYDFDQLEKSEFDADIAIIGSGAAGISIALEFANTDIRVALIESGNFKISRKNQKLNVVNNSGISYFDLSAQRGRYFGGTTNFWGGTCIPFDPIDFEDIPARSGINWPISFSEIYPYIDRAKKVCGVNISEANEIFEKLDLNSKRSEIEEFEWKPLQFSPFPFRFGEKYGAQLKESQNIAVYHNANLTSLEVDDIKTSCNKAIVRSLAGKEASISAKYFILAAGGIENPRLMLNMNSIFSNINIGRYFAEHPTAIIGKLIGADAFKVYADHQKNILLNKEIKPGLGVTEQFMKKHKLLNSLITIWPIPKDAYLISRAKMLLYLMRRREFGIKFLLNLFLIMPKSISLLPHVFNRMGGQKKEVDFIKDCFDVRLVTETLPNFDSCVSLSDKKDGLGMFRANLNWELGGVDKKTFISTAKAFKKQIESNYDVRLDLEGWILDEDANWEERINLDGHHGHHMGTTRMAMNFEEGVVDKECKVFGMKNLYIAGSSIFTTYGFANPTLMIVAFAVRLADHIKSKYQ